MATEKRIVLPGLFEKQWEVKRIFDNSPAEHLSVIGFGGSVGQGKSRLAATIARDGLIDFPGNKVLVGRNMLKNLKTTTMDEFFKVTGFPEEIFKFDRASNEGTLRLPQWPPNVLSKIFFRALADPDEIMGDEFGIIVIDEAPNVPAKSAEYAYTRLRHNLPASVKVPMKRLFLACGNPQPGWFEDWFYLKTHFKPELMAAANMSLHYIQAVMGDNPHLNAGYEAQQRAGLNEENVTRFVEGSFENFQGQIFTNFDPLRHRWPLQDLPQFTHFLGGLDFGGEKRDAHFSTGIIRGITGTGRDILLDEYKDRGANVTQRQVNWTQSVREKWAKGKPLTFVADGTQSAALSFYRKIYEGSNVGIISNERKKDSRLSNIGFIQGRLAPADDSLPKSFYLPHCTEFARQMRGYSWDERTYRDGLPQAKRVDDDVVDAYLYSTEILRRGLTDPQERFKYAVPAFAN